MDYITERTARRLVETCQSAANQTACIEDNLITAFDETGNARRGCFESTIDADPYKCVMLGAFNYSMARSAHLEDADHLDWSHPEAQLDRVMDGLADRSAAPCKQAGAANFRACAIHEASGLLSLSKEQAAGCLALQRPADLRCVVHTHLLGVVETALSRLSA